MRPSKYFATFLSGWWLGGKYVIGLFSLSCFYASGNAVNDLRQRRIKPNLKAAMVKRMDTHSIV